MSVTSALQTEHRFTTLRKRLDQLGYRQTLGIESLPLAEKIFNDLVQALDSARETKERYSELLKHQNVLEEAIHPYKEENGRVITENNKLTQRLIIEKERYEASLREHKLATQKIDAENSDLRFLNSQYLLKARQLEKECLEKSEKILELQENLQATVHLAAGRKQPTSLRRQRLEIASPPLSLAQPSLLPQVKQQCKDVYVADMLRTSDCRISQLQNQLQVLSVSHKELEVNKETFKKQVEVRNLEISRLNKLLESGRPPDAIASQRENRIHEETISKLQLQISQLEYQNERLSEELRTLPVKPEREKPRDKIIQSILNKGQNKFRSESDRHPNIKEKNLGDELWDQLKECKKKYCNLQMENENLKKNILELKTKLAQHDEERMKLETLIQEVSKDKDKVVAKAKELSLNEKELLLEIDRLNRQAPVAEETGRETGRNTDQLDSLMEYINTLETQRDHYKEEARALLRLIQSSKGNRSQQSEDIETSPKVDNAVLKLLEEERNFYKKQYQGLLEGNMTQGRRRAPSGCVSTHDKCVSANFFETDAPNSSDSTTLVNLKQKIKESEQTVSILLQEKEQLKNQYNQVHQELSRLRNLQSSDSNNEGTMRQLADQNDRLLQQLDVVNNENSSLHNHIRELEIQMGQLEDELKRCRSDLNIAIRETESVNLIQARDEALKKNQELRSQIETIRKEYKKVYDLWTAQNQRLAELEEIRIPIEADSSKTQPVPKGRLSTLETEVISMQYQVKKNEGLVQRLRNQLEESEKRQTSFQKQIEEKDQLVKISEDNRIKQEKRIDELQKILDYQTNEMSSLNALINSLDSERRQLSSGQAHKDHQVAGLQHHLMNKEAETQVTFSSMEAQITDLKLEIKEKEHILARLKKEADNGQTEVKRLEDEQDVIRRENRRLLEDLTAVTVQHQKVGEEMEMLQLEKMNFQRQIQEYVTEVTRVQELLAAKERERLDLLEQYHHLSAENGALSNQFHHLESQSVSVSHLLIGKDAELKQCQETIASLEQEVEEHISVQENYTQQMMTLNGSINVIESELDQSRREAERLREELSSAQDDCKILEEENRKLERQRYNGEADKDRLSTRLLELQEEMVQLKEYLTLSRNSVVTLESLLSSTREKEFRQQLSQQEMATEVDHLRKRLQEMEEQVDSQNKNLTDYKSEVSKLGLDVEKTKRQLTNERFEK